MRDKDQSVMFLKSVFSFAGVLPILIGSVAIVEVYDD